MKTPLNRLLRLRSLLEGASRGELEKRLKLFRTLDDLRRAEIEAAAMERRHASESLLCAENANLQTWKQANLVSRLAEQRAARMAPIVQAAEDRMAAGRGEYLDRRKERRQVETVLEGKLETERQHAERREQRMLDDWFAMRPR